MKLKTLKRWFSAQNPIMCAIFGPKNGDFQKMLRIVWNGEKCNKIKNLKNFFVSIEYSLIVLFSVLFILGIGKINNTRKLRSLVAPNQILHAMTSIILVHASPLFQGLCYRVPRGFRVEGSPFLLEIPKSRRLRNFLFYQQQQSHISIQNL